MHGNVQIIHANGVRLYAPEQLEYHHSEQPPYCHTPMRLSEKQSLRLAAGYDQSQDGRLHRLLQQDNGQALQVDIR